MKIDNVNSETTNILLITVEPIEVADCIDIDDDPEDNDRSYIEDNWASFKQVTKRICTKRTANNWHHVCAMIEWSRLVKIEEEMQLVERKRNRQTTWGST
ncbi:7511_t:CDS:2, partial [Cetraspora pellucida]